jgi:hypothetical protein
MRYIQHPVTFELIPADQYERPSSNADYHVMPDIQPYQSMIDGSIIHSRSQHRRHLKDHGCIEVGNDSSVLKPQRKPLESPPGLKETLIRVVNEKLRTN